MTWTYSGDPSKSAKDAVRFLIGDTEEQNQILQDGEILWVLSLYNQAPLNAAIRCCETAIAKYSRLVDESVGSVRMSFSQRARGFQALLTTLQNRLAMEDAVPYAGGVSVGDMQKVTANVDRPAPLFTRHMMEDWLISPWIQGKGAQSIFGGEGE